MEAWRKQLYHNLGYDETDSLAHHGIQGQKWGVKNGPPYPLGDSISTGKKLKTSGKSTRKEEEKPRKLNSGEQGAVNLSPEAKKAIAKLAVSVAVNLSVRGIANLVRSSVVKKKVNDKYSTSKVKSINDVPKLKPKKSAEKSVKEINKNYPKLGYTMNCTFCTAAMAMREKGYDVVARDSVDGWYIDKLYKNCFDGKIKQKNVGGFTFNSTIKKLQKNPPGSYGNLGVVWKQGGGHSIFWKNDNGRIRLFDAQSGDEYDTSNSGRLATSIWKGRTTSIRLDEVTPNDKALAMVEPSKRGGKR